MSDRSDSVATNTAGAQAVQTASRTLIDAIGEAIVGAETPIRLVFGAALTGGHALLEDVPGTGKTSLARAFARCAGLDFARIQFTPDLLPSDVTGLYWFDQSTSSFKLREGPIFKNLVLADEINRATPRTQSALLEAMSERQVTIEGDTRPLPDPFLVIATQNPVELEGTFPLPEAQVDRFTVRLALGYPDAAEERDLIRRHADHDRVTDLKVIPSMADGLSDLKQAVRNIHVADATLDYLVRIVRATREHSAVELGASPRAGLHLHRMAQATAAMAGRSFVIPDDIKSIAAPVLAHRIMLEAGASLRGRQGHQIIDEVLATEPAPVEKGS